MRRKPIVPMIILPTMPEKKLEPIQGEIVTGNGNVFRDNYFINTGPTAESEVLKRMVHSMGLKFLGELGNTKT